MKRIFKKNKIKPFRVFDENGLSSLPRIILSSAVVILFFYSLPIVINFTHFCKIFLISEYLNGL